MRTRLVIDGLAFRAPITGVGRYSSGLVTGLLERNPNTEAHFVTLGNDPLDLTQVNVPTGATVHVHHAGRWSASTYRAAIAAGLAPPMERIWPVTRKADAIIFPNFVTYPTALECPKAVIIYDATFRLFPQDKTTWFRVGWSRLTRKSRNGPASNWTISEASRRDLLDQFPRGRPIGVLYPGISSAPIPDSPGALPQGVQPPYVLLVGTGSARKNAEIVLQAHQLLDAGRRPQLVIVGSGHPHVAGVNVLGFVEQNILDTLMRSASALIAPSLNEGFDLPVIEAIKAGTSVIASDIPVHREVLGDDWPLLFPPTDANRLAVLLEACKDLPPPPAPSLFRFDWATAAETLGTDLGI